MDWVTWIALGAATGTVVGAALGKFALSVGLGSFFGFLVALFCRSRR